MAAEIKKLNVVNPFADLLKSMTDEEKALQDKKAMEHEAELNRITRFNAFKVCGIGPKYFDCSFDNFEVKTDAENRLKDAALKFCQDIKAGKQSSLILYGNYGAGKTHIATAILRRMMGTIKQVTFGISEFYSGHYTTVNDFVNNLLNCGYDNKRKTDLINEATDSDVCVFDELGRLANNRMNEPDVMFQVIDSIYQNKKNIILITNLSLPEVKKLVGAASISRLSENNLSVVDCSGINDHRSAV